MNASNHSESRPKSSAENHSGARSFGNLAGAQFMLLTTFRRSGEAVPTTVWFAEANGKLYVTTGGESGKVKRVRNSARVSVAPCDRTGHLQGTFVDGVARVLESGTPEDATAQQALEQKYGMQLKMIQTMGRLRGGPRTSVHIEIAPTSVASQAE